MPQDSPSPFLPPRGGVQSQAGGSKPLPAPVWQPPESLSVSPFWRYSPDGVLLGWAGPCPVGVADDRHLVTIAGARAGKTSTLLIPNLLLWRGSCLVLDPKGELAAATAGQRAEKLGHTVYVLDPWRVAAVPDGLRVNFDPIAELRDGEAANRIDDAALMAEALIEGQGENNRHWTDSARDFLRAVILWQCEGAPADYANFARLPVFLADCMGVDEKTPDEENPFAALAFFKPASGCPAEVAEAIRSAGRGMMGTPFKERASILSTCRNQLGFLESAAMRDSVSSSAFQLRDLKRYDENGLPVTVYLCLPASRMGTHSKWLRMFLNQTMAALEDTSIAKPPLPVLLMLEEFAALGHMRSLEQASAYLAGFGVKLWVVLQDLTQLKRHYKDGWETFIANAGMVTAFGNTDQTTLDYLSKQLGDTFAHVREEVEQGQRNVEGGAALSRETVQRVPLLAPHELATAFGRQHSRLLALAAGGAPVALERRLPESGEALQADIRKGLADG